MVAAKPDCTGQKFGYLTVLGKGGRSPIDNRQLWRLRCDCGKIIEKPRCNFANKPNPSCGCQKRRKVIERNEARSRPDITGQRFGRLLVLGKGAQKPDKRGQYIQLWKMQCDCGRVIEIPRYTVDRGRQISCGCARSLGLIDNKRRPTDIAGQKFGNLTAIALSGKKDSSNKPTWNMQCDCGNICQKSLSELRRREYYGIRINCGDRSKHPEYWLEYPPTPNPYPKESGELLKKYLPLTELGYEQIDSAVEDEKRDRLIRACWILTYRRSRGEKLSELYEQRFIKKHLRYCSIDVFWRRKIEEQGGFLYNASNSKKQIGIAMTNTTSLDYPEIETQGIKFLSSDAKPKRLKFKRC